MPQLIQHIPIERDRVPTPQTLAPILKAAQPGRVTLLCAPPRFPLTETLLSLSLELAETRKTMFVNCAWKETAVNKCFRSVVEKRVLKRARKKPLSDEDLKSLETFAATNAMKNLKIAHHSVTIDNLPEWTSSNGAVVIDYAQIFTLSPQAVADFAKTRNVAVVEGLMINSAPVDPSSPIPGLDKFSRRFVKIADAAFALHDERRR